MRFSPGTRLGPYELLGLLGAGGMGEVYRARDPRLNREVAVKVLPSEVAGDPDRLRRFEQEARAAGALNHPNVLAVYDIGSHEGVPYAVSELLEGETLRDRLADGVLTPRKAVDFAVQIAHGLAAAHEKGIVHRDLKPENLFITRDNRVKILDFGLAKLREPESDVSQAGTATGKNEILGTVGYMSPEQVKGKAVDYRSDLFAFGAVLYEMLSTRKAFRKETGAETLAAILNEDPPDLSASDSNVPFALSRIVRRCLEKRPEERFQSARDLAFALEALSGSSEAAPALKGLTSEKAPSGSRRRTAMLVGGAVILAALGWGARHFRKGDASRENPIAGARFTRLTDFEGSELDADISADGKFVAFLADRDGPFDAFVGQVGGTGFINLTKSQFPQLFSEGVRNVGFSHDGAYVWVHVVDSKKSPPDHSTWLIPTLGGLPRPFLPTAVSVAWSPDGSRVLYHEAGPGDPIFIADGSGGNPKPLLADKKGIHWHYPAWSVDGRFTFLSRGVPPNDMDIWRIPSGGGEPERMTSHDSIVGYPALLDQRTLVYCAIGEDDTSSALYAMDLESRATRRISSGLEEYLSVAASADGFRLVATVANPSRTLWSVPITDQIEEETAARRLPIGAVRAAGPRSGADYLLFLSSRGGADGLWKYKDGQETEVWSGSEGGVAAAPAISPDGQAICFSVRRGGRSRLYLMAANGTNARPLAESLDVRNAPSWSPDSRWIAVVALDPKVAGIFKVPVDGHPPVRLVDGLLWNPVWSPDGRFVVYSEPLAGAQLRVKAVTADGAPFPLPDLQVLWKGDRYRFMPDGKRLVVMLGGFRRQDFWLLDLRTGERRRLTNLRPGDDMKSFDVSPDGRQIVFDRVKENSDIVLIDRVRR